MSEQAGVRLPELATVLVVVSPELVAMLEREWSEPLQVKITPLEHGRYAATLGATHEMVAIRHTCVPKEPAKDHEDA